MLMELWITFVLGFVKELVKPSIQASIHCTIVNAFKGTIK